MRPRRRLLLLGTKIERAEAPAAPAPALMWAALGFDLLPLSAATSRVGGASVPRPAARRLALAGPVSGGEVMGRGWAGERCGWLLPFPICHPPSHGPAGTQGCSQQPALGLRLRGREPWRGRSRVWIQCDQHAGAVGPPGEPWSPEGLCTGRAGGPALGAPCPGSPGWEGPHCGRRPPRGKSQ